MATVLNKIVNMKPIAMHRESKEWPLSNQLIGIELELEGLDKNSIYAHEDKGQPHWVYHNDPSLRGGSEYVLKNPMMGMELSESISYFFANFKGIGKSSARASTHIHINMLQEEDTLEVLRNMTAIYYALEDGIYTAISESRKWAVYAAPLSGTFPREVSLLFTQELPVREWTQLIARKTGVAGGGRYYGYNMKAMSRFGTVEFRHFPAVSTEQELRSWVTLVMELKKAAIMIDGRGQTVKDFLATEEAFDNLYELMPTWWPILDKCVDRTDSIIKVQSLYELLPVAQRYSSDYNAFTKNPLFNKVVVPAKAKTVAKKNAKTIAANTRPIVVQEHWELPRAGETLTTNMPRGTVQWHTLGIPDGDAPTPMQTTAPTNNTVRPFTTQERIEIGNIPTAVWQRAERATRTNTGEGMITRTRNILATAEEMMRIDEMVARLNDGNRERT